MKTLKTISIHILIISLLIIPVIVSAQADPTTPPKNTNTTVGINIQNPFAGGNNLTDLITAILNKVVMPIAAVGVVIWIVWAGFSFVIAQGKPEKINEAKSRLLWSLIGAGILLGAAAISEVVQRTVGALITK